MSDDEADFTQVFRGYDKDEVTKAVQSLRRELIHANTQNAEAGRRSNGWPAASTISMRKSKR